MNELDLKKSLAVSLAFHAFLFLVLSIVFINVRFETTFEPVSVNIVTDSASMAAGITEALDQPARRNRPSMTRRITQPADTKALPEKTAPSASVLKSFTKKTETLKDRTKKVTVPDARQELKKEERREEPAAESAPAPDPEKIREQELRERTARELRRIEGDIDRILDEPAVGPVSPRADSGGSPGQDPLGDASWSAQPRKTVFFPNIQARIPPNYRKKGLSYSVTSRIAFDKNGLAVRVDIITSSGDPAIDSIFFTELKKIRVEAIEDSRVDVITKTFSISLK